jgi:hypothetical protein
MRDDGRAGKAEGEKGVKDMDKISCRPGCGACCIAPSISSPVPGMPQGKPAGVRCVQLTPENHCTLYGKPGRPDVCGSYRASDEFCGSSRSDAMRLLRELEVMTVQPDNKKYS